MQMIFVPFSKVWNVFVSFLKLGLFSFGGPLAHVSYLRKELIEKQGWITPKQFSDLVVLTQILPGPSSSQLGFVLGVLRAGGWGGVAAFVGFTLPSVILLVVFAHFFAYIENPLGMYALHGLKIAACAIVLDTLLKMWNQHCDFPLKKMATIISALLFFMFSNTFCILGLIFFGALLGVGSNWNTYQLKNPSFKVPFGIKTSLILGLIYLFGLGFLYIPEFNHIKIIQFLKSLYLSGSLVFGGGHVVLPLLENTLVSGGYISEHQFFAGYGASQAIPGPLFSFAAYLGYLVPTDSNPILGATLGLVALFSPGFLFVSLALPLWNKICAYPRGLSMVSGINATVVGLLGATLLDPMILKGVQHYTDALLILVSFLLMYIKNFSAIWIVMVCVIIQTLFFMEKLYFG